VAPLRHRPDPGERRRTSRHAILPGFGPDAQARLGGARVLVVGAGGLGSPVLYYLAAAGVGVLGVVDDDDVAASNLQRQILHGGGDVGAPKTASAAAALRALGSPTQVVEHRLRLTASNAGEVLAGYDLVIDGCDTFATRYVVGDAAARLGLPVVWGTVLGWDGQVSVWWSAAPHGRGLTYRDVFGEQPPEGDSCSSAGVLGPACGVVGTTMAVEAVKLLTGTGEPALGRLLVYDARTSAWDTVELSAPANPDPQPDLDGEGSGQSQLQPQRQPETVGAGGGAGDSTLVIDVGVHPVVPGAVWVRLDDLAAGELPDTLHDYPQGAPLVVVCDQGLRSRGAAGLLRAEGWLDVQATTYAALANPAGHVA
jgi:adenylyltransferase/sulfurtransferase